MMDTDAGRVPLAPGSRPTDQAPLGLGASRFDPSRGALDLIKSIGIYGLGGNDGCPCTSFMVQDVNVDISCHKSGDGPRVRVYSNSLDFAGEDYALDIRYFDGLAEEVLRQVDAYYDAGGEYAATYEISYASYEQEYPR